MPKSLLVQGYIGIMEKRMETAIMGYIGYNIGVYIGDNGKENGVYYRSALLLCFV